MATYVLVPGGYCGGWAWKDVARLMRRVGHEVYTPTFTGLGEREHLAHPGIDLDTHITDITNVFRYENLWDVILVAWSYGGSVISGVAERVPERLGHLVYMDAMVLRDGEACVDLYDDPKAMRATAEGMLAEGKWGVPHPPPAPNRVDHPIRTFLQPLAIRDPKAAEIPRTFIYCTKDKGGSVMSPIVRSAQRAREAGWRYHELPTGHCCLWTMPQETADLLMGVTTAVDV